MSREFPQPKKTPKSEEKTFADFSEKTAQPIDLNLSETGGVPVLISRDLVTKRIADRKIAELQEEKYQEYLLEELVFLNKHIDELTIEEKSQLLELESQLDGKYLPKLHKKITNNNKFAKIEQKVKIAMPTFSEWAEKGVRLADKHFSGNNISEKLADLVQFVKDKIPKVSVKFEQRVAKRQLFGEDRNINTDNRREIDKNAFPWAISFIVIPIITTGVVFSNIDYIFPNLPKNSQNIPPPTLTIPENDNTPKMQNPSSESLTIEQSTRSEINRNRKNLSILRDHGKINQNDFNIIIGENDKLEGRNNNSRTPEDTAYISQRLTELQIVISKIARREPVSLTYSHGDISPGVTNSTTLELNQPPETKNEIPQITIPKPILDVPTAMPAPVQPPVPAPEKD